jgi:hypothetical protein
MLGVGLLALPVFAWLLFAVCYDRRSPTERLCDRIKEGMTVGDVEAICGGPEGDYRTPAPFATDEWRTRFSTRIKRPDKQYWNWDDGTVVVLFDSGGRVTGSVVILEMHRKDTFLDRLRRLLPW